VGDAAEDALIGRTIAEKFKIEAFVGRGSMGSVYKARQLALKKTVALKVMRVHGTADRAYGIRFKREASFASKLDHPNSVRVVDFGQEPDGLLYMAMDFVQGKNLHAVLDSDWPLPVERMVTILAQTLAALHVAHGMGIIHRDLKPANILLVQRTDDDGNASELVKVCDFGVAKFLEEDGPGDGDGRSPSGISQSHNTTLTAHGMTVGTPAYMSPEQALGEKMDARSDIYAMGVIMFEMLTKRLPFDAGTPIKMMLKHVHAIPPRPSELCENVDARLEQICVKALHKSPDQRFQSAREMRAELLRESGGPQVGGERQALTMPPAAPLPGPRSTVRTDPPKSLGAAPTVEKKPAISATLVLSVVAVILALCALILAMK
jgi:eukaryotic-like serine/threonine-protein kinase